VPKAVHWVKPQLLAEVGFTEMTSDGKLRHPSFQGLRDDKPAQEVGREVPQPTAKVAAAKAGKAAPPVSAKASPNGQSARSKAKPAAAPGGDTVAGVRLTHPERVLYPDVSISKRDLAAYYEAVADHVLPPVRRRPLALVRCPEGVGGQSFYMKHPPKGTSDVLGRVTIREQSASGEYLVADSLAAIVSLVQLSVLEIHTWNSTADDLEQPDRVIFDLDPGPQVAWAAGGRGAGRRATRPLHHGHAQSGARGQDPARLFSQPARGHSGRRLLIPGPSHRFCLDAARVGRDRPVLS
jgi:bifunctional non-homologous end joining protein LigD